jgi:hypothetical protein
VKVVVLESRLISGGDFEEGWCDVGLRDLVSWFE